MEIIAKEFTHAKKIETIQNHNLTQSVHCKTNLEQDANVVHSLFADSSQLLENQYTPSLKVVSWGSQTNVCQHVLLTIFFLFFLPI